MPAASSSANAAAQQAAQRVATVLSKGSSHAELQRVRGQVEQELEQERALAEDCLRQQQHGQGPPPAMGALQARLEVRFVWCVVDG